MRARNIKPEFYKDAKLEKCSIAARLLLPGLAMMSDSTGLMMIDVDLIKKQIFPTRALSVASLLSELEENGIIEIVKLGDHAYLQIVEFFKFFGRYHPPKWQTVRKKVFRRDNYTCRYCGKRAEKLECDHMVPVSRGGPHTIDNLATACKECNASKGSKTPEEWFR